MTTCKDCIHYDVCHRLNSPSEFIKLNNQADDCNMFKDKRLFIELPCKPTPLMKDKNPFNCDFYCPTCGTNISGYYGDEPLSVVQCFNCGELLDNTKAITREEAEAALKARTE